MGRQSRLQYLPSELGRKLLRIRQSFDFTQSELLRELQKFGDFSSLTQNIISDFERNRREPPPMVLYAYAQLANVYIEALINDKVELPEKLPAIPKSEGITKKN
jgi:transcriptional regulator with XRE-family HTH domain